MDTSVVDKTWKLKRNHSNGGTERVKRDAQIETARTGNSV